MKKVYCVYDSKVEAYGMPLLFMNKGDAIRGFSEICNDKQTQIGKYPADFTMFELGSYDESTAKFVLYSTPVSVGVALEFVKDFRDPNGVLLEDKAVA